MSTKFWPRTGAIASGYLSTIVRAVTYAGLSNDEPATTGVSSWHAQIAAEPYVVQNFSAADQSLVVNASAHDVLVVAAQCDLDPQLPTDECATSGTELRGDSAISDDLVEGGDTSQSQSAGALPSTGFSMVDPPGRSDTPIDDSRAWGTSGVSTAAAQFDSDRSGDRAVSASLAPSRASGVRPIAVTDADGILSSASIGATGDTISHAGSGLVFNNTYDSGVTTAFHNEIVAVENYFQSIFTNACTINCEFDAQSINPNFSGENFFSPVHVSYSSFVSSLTHEATTTVAQQATAALSNLADPSKGAGFSVSVGEARILGLAGSGGSSADDKIILNSVYWTASALQNNPGDAEGVLEHELSEGIMGRVGGLGVTGAWAPMDLFRFTAAGQRDFTGGQDGQLTYFSPNGSNVYTGLQFHNSVNNSGHFDGFDFADWDQVGADANAKDPFGPGGPGVGDPGTLSSTDIQVLEALGWSPSTPPPIVQSPADDFNGDGMSDILFQNTDGTPSIWEMNGTSIIAAAGLPNPSPSWPIVGTGDFNGDGKADILLQNTDGTPSIWEMNGTSIIGVGALPNPGPTWHIVGTGDFNGDGKSDILFQNTDGTPSIWEMSGTSIIGVGALPNPSAAWHIVSPV